MLPLEKYQTDLLRPDFYADPAQEDAIHHTQILYKALLDNPPSKDGLFGKFRKRLQGSDESLIKGLYFWGGVGRGKTYIMDSFYYCLPFAEKQRIHFHRFMRMVHQQLKQIKGVVDPLDTVAAGIAENTRVLCFDEFHVSDITDAMLLGGLLRYLFERKVVLVATSNEAPDRLYWDGLQRERFLSAIELIKTYTKVINIDSEIDYRLRFLDKVETYHYPLDDQGSSMLYQNFSYAATGDGTEGLVLEIEGRPMKTVYCTEGVVWFEFSTLCEEPRTGADYIEIARLFQTVLVANIPLMDDIANDQAKRFIILIDEFYDRHVKLIVTAAVTPDKLYQGTRLAMPFCRTASRLQEMQTRSYLSKQHIP